MNAREKRMKALKAQFQKSAYIRGEWKTAAEDKMSLKEYASWIDPSFAHLVGDVEIIAKTDSKGEAFLKAEYHFDNGYVGEYPLSFNHEFEEGDILAHDSLLFCVETKLEKTHTYLTGELS